jgi:hypothetical protein
MVDLFVRSIPKNGPQWMKFGPKHRKVKVKVGEIKADIDVLLTPLIREM